MGKDGVDWLIAIKKRPNFRTQRDRKIQDETDGNSLGNRCRAMRSLTAIAIAGMNSHSTHGALLEPVWNPLQGLYTPWLRG
jgi:hypothetical protein